MSGNEWSRLSTLRVVPHRDAVGPRVALPAERREVVKDGVGESGSLRPVQVHVNEAAAALAERDSDVCPFVEEALDKGTYPKWNPYIFCGMPSFASLQSAPYIDLLGDVVKGASWVLSKVFPLSSFTRILINYFLLG